ncbi:uncharacterized protein [Onthophagus taurus]|uniref:uncharacterized protein n=1 Tax=Onthophagus taurus TaxID=166361 RepID=UPI0039BE5875
MESQKIYNVLLLGETGVGKSTFINTVLNYIAYNELSDIKQLKYSIGVRFTVMDDDFTERTIVVDHDSNEEHQVGKSATKRPQMHRIDLQDGSILNIIDTPGLGDTQGIETDYKNVEKVLEFISEMEYLHGICIMMKPNNSRLSVIFEYCIKTILGQLDENIRKNVIFIFSNGRSSFYTPGDTQIPLEKVLKSVDITRRNPVPFDYQNTFCIESDWFRYIAAKSAQVKFAHNQVSNFEDSFKKSSEEVKRMIKYIKSAPPRQIKGLLSVNEAKRLIRRLSSTIASCLTTQRKNWIRLNTATIKTEVISSTKKQLEGELMVDVKVPAEQLTRVSTHQTTTTTKIGGFLGVNYNEDISTEFNERDTTNTVVLEKKVEDPDVKAKLSENERHLNKAKQEREDIETEIKDLDDEFATLLHASAQFYQFLKENVPFNTLDEVQVYLEKMKKESEILNDNDDVNMYKSILKKYKAKKASIYAVRLEEIDETIKNMLNLKYSGPILKQKLEIDGEKKPEIKSGEESVNIDNAKPQSQVKLKTVDVIDPKTGQD